MKRINNQVRLQNYIEVHNLQSYMDTDLSSISCLCSFEKDEHLIQIDRSSDYIYFLVEGTAMVYTHFSDIKYLNINHIQATSLIGEASSLWDMPPKGGVRAMTPCICVSIPLKEYRETLQRDVLFLQNICQILSIRLNTGITLANSLKEPVEVRLAKFLLENSIDNEISVQLTTCATILNVSYRHLLRTITGFCRDSVLVKKKNSYYISDRETLIRLANKTDL